MAATKGGGTLQPVQAGLTPNGFRSAARGWNTYSIQVVTNIIPGFEMNQSYVQSQCDVLGNSQALKDAGYTLCSIDGGWDSKEADEFGRIVYNDTIFDIPPLAAHVHSQGLQLGVYARAGFPCTGLNRTIKGTNIKMSDVWNGNNDTMFCDFDFSKDGVQQWHDSQLELWTSWGVDMVKLDFLTPGSPQNGAKLPLDNSQEVVAWHNAIKNSGKHIRLDISWKLCRNETYYDIWRANAESMRTDQDVNNYGGTTLVTVREIQRAIENYRQYINLQVGKDRPLTIYPDMDSLFVGNVEAIGGINDNQRKAVMSYWGGAGSNLILGNDMTQLDSLGMQLLTSKESTDMVNFCSQWPMQPRNPGTGENTAQQLQAWIAGPAHTGEAYVLLSNLGPNMSTAGYPQTLNGTQTVNASLADLGINNEPCYNVQDIWDGGFKQVKKGGFLAAELGVMEVQMLKLTPCSSGW